MFQLLEDLIKTHGDMSEYYRTPSLGQHYTTRWAKEDLEAERAKGSSSVASNNANSAAAGDTGDSKEGVAAEAALKKGAESSSEEATPFGELTQRLIGGLMEENIMTSVSDKRYCDRECYWRH